MGSSDADADKKCAVAAGGWSISRSCQPRLFIKLHAQSQVAFCMCTAVTECIRLIEVNSSLETTVKVN